MEAVLLAAGEGTRLRPLTITRPKPMLPLAGKPILEWNLDALSDAGFRKAVIIVGYRKEEIVDYFGKAHKNLEIVYVTQDQQLGTGNAVLTAKDHIKGDAFLAMNGDIITSAKTIRSFTADWKNRRHAASIALVEVDNPSNYGVIRLKGSIVEEIEEKPEKPKSNLANAGIYLLKRGIFETLSQLKKSSRNEYEITDALKALIPKRDVSGFTCKGIWMDIGLPWHLLDANEIMMKTLKQKPSRKAIIEKNATIKGSVHVGEKTILKSGTYIEGPCYIGKGCIIGPNCYIRPYTMLGDNCHVGNAVEIKNSIIMQNTKIGHLSYVGDSIIGQNCNFGAGTTVANLRFDDGGIMIDVKGTLTNSGRRKFGCLMGDNVKTGINVSIMPGRSIYPNAIIEPMTTVRNTIYAE
ncbi:MAG: sugar phosphate nucleotidyltransferase [Candidatus Altiarchaeota archaeon]|nr:sugar phosphate nucleotidyltransferase [Candidatus Altiarchaeota archaeon]